MTEHRLRTDARADPGDGQEDAMEVVSCMGCRWPLLARPGLCHSCSKLAGLDPNSAPAPTYGLMLRLPERDAVERERRVGRYAARAAAGLPLFAEPSEG